MRVNDKHNSGKLAHLSYSAEVRIELSEFFFKLSNFLFGKKLELAVLLHLFDFNHSVDTRANGFEVGERAAQPTRVYIIHTATLRLFSDSVLSLLFGADEKYGFAFLNAFANEFVSLFYAVYGNLQVDNMNIVARRIDVLGHFGVPFSRLVPEVYARFEQLLHRNNCHNK